MREINRVYLKPTMYVDLSHFSLSLLLQTFLLLLSSFHSFSHLTFNNSLHFLFYLFFILILYLVHKLFSILKPKYRHFGFPSSPYILLYSRSSTKQSELSASFSISLKVLTASDFISNSPTKVQYYLK